MQQRRIDQVIRIPFFKKKISAAASNLNEDPRPLALASTHECADNVTNPAPTSSGNLPEKSSYRRPPLLQIGMERGPDQPRVAEMKKKSTPKWIPERGGGANAKVPRYNGLQGPAIVFGGGKRGGRIFFFFL